MYQGDFARQWFNRENIEPFSCDAILFEQSLQKGDYERASYLLRHVRLNSRYWIRQKHRYKRILSNFATNKKSVSISFKGFWNSFPHNDNQILDILRAAIDRPIEVVRSSLEDADLEICTCFNLKELEALAPSSTRILWLGENVSPNYIGYDYSLTHDMFDYSGKNLYLPLWKLELHIPPFKLEYKDKLETLSSVDVISSVSIEEGDFDSRKFCCMFTGNMHPMRASWLRYLSEIDEVDCFGVMFENKIESKHDIMNKYKFCFTPENSFAPGYITEKLIQCRRNKSVPIYWGGAVCSEQFNSRSFVNLDPVDPLKVLAEIQRAGSNINIFREYLSNPLVSDCEISLSKEIHVIQGWSKAF